MLNLSKSAPAVRNNRNILECKLNTASTAEEKVEKK